MDRSASRLLPGFAELHEVLAHSLEAGGIRIDGGNPARQLLQTEAVLDPGREVVATLALAGERREHVEVDRARIHALEPFPELGQRPGPDARGHREDPRLHEEKQLTVDDARNRADVRQMIVED